MGRCTLPAFESFDSESVLPHYGNAVRWVFLGFVYSALIITIIIIATIY